MRGSRTVAVALGRRAILMGAVLVLALLNGQRTWQAGGSTTLLVGVASAESQARLAPVLRYFGASVRDDIGQISVLVVDVPAATVNALTDHLRRSPEVRYAEVSEPFAAELMGMPGDPMVKDQWNLVRVQAPQAWDLLPKGGNTIVAVLDTGVDRTHPDLAGVISPNGCNAYAHGCPQPADRPLPSDLSGHGTHVAGIIGAIPDNGLGIAGVAGGRVTLLPITVGNRGGGVAPHAYLRGIVYAVDAGARVINMSFGAQCGRQAWDAYRDAIAYAEARDVLIVTSAGNDGGCYTGRYPQDDPRVLTVTASDTADTVPAWSGAGSYVAVAAPGVSVMSTVPMLFGGYRTYSGTSMAAPHVAAQAALLFQVPGATKAKVMDWIKRTCDPINVIAQCGGRINVYRSVVLATTGVDPGAPQQPAATTAPPAAASVPDGDEL